MSKKIKLFFFVSLILISTIFIGPSVLSIADDDCEDCQISTEPGDADYSKMSCACPGETFTIMDNNIEIEQGQTITIEVEGGCAPFIWQNPGNGYSWVNGEDVGSPEDKTKMTTVRNNQLQCVTGT
jgi:hypothetical protein